MNKDSNNSSKFTGKVNGMFYALTNVDTETLETANGDCDDDKDDDKILWDGEDVDEDGKLVLKTNQIKQRHLGKWTKRAVVL